ncbi:MAG: stage II sporulation protein E, partial [Lachnospiraceae bacterium]|nr:stage II sporulation protein E [Lachnospiraceae bacterium]
MQEWIIAMLVISGMLIIRDMAKTILAGRNLSNGEVNALYEEHPQKERVEKYAKSFQKLAETYYGMPYRKDYLSNVQVEKIFQEVHSQMCRECHQREVCWKQKGTQTYHNVYQLVRSIESGQEELIRKSKGEWMGYCARSQQFYQELSKGVYREKQNLIWNNRMIENRLAVAGQLTEISHMMQMVAENLYDIVQPEEEFIQELK